MSLLRSFSGPYSVRMKIRTKKTPNKDTSYRHNNLIGVTLEEVQAIASVYHTAYCGHVFFFLTKPDVQKINFYAENVRPRYQDLHISVLISVLVRFLILPVCRLAKPYIIISSQVYIYEIIG